MTDYSELKRLAEAFPADLDWDSNTEPFFNGPAGESLGGGATGFYSVYGKPFRLEGEDYDYDGPTYVEACTADFAKFMVAAREGVLALIAENEALRASKHTVECRFEVSEDTLETIRGCLRAAEGDIDQLKAENEVLRKDKSEPCDGCFMADVEALRKNSARYLHLKATWDDGLLLERLGGNVLPQDWDAEIDKDMSKEG